MSSDCFQFLHFDLYQDRCAMKLGTDALLLGAWTETDKATDILDIGTGTGVLSLMLAQKNSIAQIDALEIDLAAVLQARENIARTPWSERIQVHHLALQNWQPAKRYALIICNPPYYQSGRQAQDVRRRQARHGLYLNYQDLLSHSQNLLTAQGKLSLILPDSEVQRFLAQAFAMGFKCSRHCKIQHSQAHPVGRHLLELRHGASQLQQQSQTHTLILKTEQGQWSSDYRHLTRKFHRQCAH